MALAVDAIDDICKLFINCIAHMSKEMSLREALCGMYLMSNKLESAFRALLKTGAKIGWPYIIWTEKMIPRPRAKA